MACGDLFIFLFGGLGATVVGVYLTKMINDRARYRTVQVSDRVRVTTPRTELPTVYQPSPEPPQYYVLPRVTPQVPSPSRSAAPNLDSPSGGYYWNSRDFTVAVEPTHQIIGNQASTVPRFKKSQSVLPAGTPAADPFFSAVFNFQPELAKIVSFNEDAIGLATNDKFVYADKKEGVVLASSFNPDKWEAAEFRRTETEIVYRLRKKPGAQIQSLPAFPKSAPCPYCGKELRTPLAKQCRHCKRSWR